MNAKRPYDFSRTLRFAVHMVLMNAMANVLRAARKAKWDAYIERKRAAERERLLEESLSQDELHPAPEHTDPLDRAADDAGVPRQGEI